MTSPQVESQLSLINELDLEPIAFKLVHPELGEEVMTVEMADRLILKYRRFLKLCAMYPELGIVPSKEIDQVWHTHILDTAKYMDDCNAVFGFMLHHFPYFGMRGPDDFEQLQQMSVETRSLYLKYFGEHMSTSAADDAQGAVALCSNSCDSGTSCNTSWQRERPRLVRA